MSPKMLAGDKASTAENYKKTIMQLRYISTAALVIGVVAIAVGFFALGAALNKGSSTTSVAGTTAHGQTLQGINSPLNATELAIINNAPDSYYTKAGQMYLSNSLANPIFVTGGQIVKPLNSGNGKATVLYLGSTTCVFCGENRWAMALALSRFGSFTSLFRGYSALGDQDVPTLYWRQDQLNGSSDDIGNYYSSAYINFLSIEDTHPINGSFSINPLSTMQQNIANTNNATYINAFRYILNLSKNASTAFAGTPYTIWGNHLFLGADAAIFGNSSSSAPAPFANAGISHAQILKAFANPNSQFAWSEYAAADVYVAALCKSMGGNSPPICSNSTIQAISAKLQ